MKTDILWDEFFDDDDNVFVEGMSVYTTDQDPDAAPDLSWRIRQRLRRGKIEWYACHDSELGGETGETWETLGDAKAAIQKQHNEIIRQELGVDVED